jgi:hypothetical protein
MEFSLKLQFLLPWERPPVFIELEVGLTRSKSGRYRAEKNLCFCLQFLSRPVRSLYLREMNTDAKPVTTRCSTVRSNAMADGATEFERTAEETSTRTSTELNSAPSSSHLTSHEGYYVVCHL